MEEGFDAKIRERAAEKHGRNLSCEEAGFIPFFSRAIEQLDLIA